MKRSAPLQRRTPLARTGFKRKEPKPFALADRKTLERHSAIKRRTRKKRATKAEREHMGVVAGLYCIVCRNLRFGDSPAEVHHVRYLAGGGQRSGNLDTIPLCPRHHRIGGYGVAFHAGPEIWQQKYGTEAELLEQTRRETGNDELEAA
ncbi:Ref family recombination enhancement nuclease [Paraburkholderia hospita]|uniref:Ref family recombination enhancement nuclease n=1 Tax=Paraburkholderia hospita TaxID=169430 RepID=UPI003ECF9818